MLQGICELAQQWGEERLGASLLGEYRGQRFRVCVIFGGGRDIGNPGGVFSRSQRWRWDWRYRKKMMMPAMIAVKTGA